MKKNIRFIINLAFILLVTEPEIIPPKALKLLERIFEFLEYIIKPNGTLPLVVDSDEAHFIPLIFFNDENNINQDLLNLCAVLFNRSDFKLKYKN